MMNKTGIKYIAFAAALLALASCESEIATEQADKLSFTFDASQNLQSDIVPFTEDGAPQTRTTFAGDQFESGDLIKMRIVAPFTSSVEWGEYTDGNTHDNFWILQWNGSHPTNWGSISSNRGFDLNGDFSASSSSSIWTLSQGTPYIFTASTWTEEIHSIVSTQGKPGGDVYTWFYNVFKADQHKLSDYKSSDVMWAQQFMQTGTENIHLSFNHKMAALCIDISAFKDSLDLTEETDEIVLTLENMPDIDQQEIVIGNYYAGAIKGKGSNRAGDSKYYRPNYGDWQRTACSREDNGKVLGISVINEAQAKVEQVAFTSPSRQQNATYTFYHVKGNTSYYLIIPPYTVPEDVKPTLWLRQGTKRWSAELTLPTGRTFESGKRYHSKLQMKPVPDPDPDPTPDPNA